MKGTATDTPEDSPTDDVLELLRSSGDHPLLASFPRGAFFAFDHGLRYLCAGGLGLQDVGLSREMLEGRTIFEVFPATTASTIEPLYRAALAGQTTTWDVPYEDRVYSQRLAPVFDRTGGVVAGLGFTVDMTDERLAEAALRASEERNRLTFEYAPIGKAIVGLDGTWVSVNAAVTRLLGYSAEELSHMTFGDVTHPDDLDLDMQQAASLLNGEIDNYQMEKRYITASGRTVWVLLSGAIVRDSAGEPLYFIAQIQDVTETRRQRDALRDLNAMLAHDLRSPAAAILGIADIIETVPDLDLDDARRYAHRISSSARNLTQLLDNVMTATAVESGDLVARPEHVTTSDAVRLVLDTSDLGDLHVDLSELSNTQVFVDPGHFHQVLTNLLSNVRKYGGNNVTITDRTHEDGRVSIAVTDSGPGVEPDFVPHLFDRHSRSASARQGGERGSGLGLWIVRDLMAANDGTVTYESSTPCGATFLLDLPASRSQDQDG